MARTSRILQWNCRSLNLTASDLRARLGILWEDSLLLTLLQETRGYTPNIKGHRVHTQPSIMHKNVLSPQGQAAIYVQKGLTYAAVPTVTTSHVNCQAVAIRLAESTPAPPDHCSVYVYPGTGNSRSTDFDWIRQLWQTYPQINFSSAMTSTPSTPSGATPQRHSYYWKQPMTATRNFSMIHPGPLMGLHANQADISPDLTWASKGLAAAWAPGEDIYGSDQFALWITFNKKGLIRTKTTPNCG